MLTLLLWAHHARTRLYNIPGSTTVYINILIYVCIMMYKRVYKSTRVRVLLLHIFYIYIYIIYIYLTRSKYCLLLCGMVKNMSILL